MTRAASPLAALVPPLGGGDHNTGYVAQPLPPVSDARRLQRLGAPQERHGHITTLPRGFFPVRARQVVELFGAAA